VKLELPPPLQRAWPWLLTLLYAALFIVSTVIVFIEESRSPALQKGFYSLWTLMLVKSVWDTWRDWRKGLLTMPLSELHRHIAQGGGKRTSLLEFSSLLMGIAAMTILTLP
jgi:hypothetical protein